MSRRLALAMSLTFASTSTSFAQTGSLADYIKQHNIDPPFIVVAPEKVQSNQKASGLAQFGHKLVRIGELSAIVPETMVTFDDKLTKEPDLYEGLPRRSKVIYLLALLNKSQWDKATGKGIGLSDLSGEQRNVFTSLVPKPLKWSTIKIDKEGIPEDPINPQVVSGNSLNQVRLRLTRGLTLVPTVGRSFFYMDIGGAGQTPGATVKIRDSADDMAEGLLYGVQIRKTVENRTKPSDIAYSDSSWNTKVALKGQWTVSELLRDVGTVTGKSLLASPYVSELNVQGTVGSARAGDVLQALAQCLTGTYRKVGQTFFLTSDLSGAGSRQLRLALWVSAVQQESARRDMEGMAKIAGSGFLKTIDFDSNNVFAPTDAMRAQILAEEGGERKTIGVSELPEAIRAQIESTTKLMQPPAQYNEVGMTSRFLYGFVLPNGDALEPERDELGTTDQFYRPAPANNPPMALNPRSMGPFKIANHAAKSIMLRADSPTAAQTALNIAQTYGFSELLLETSNPAAIKACTAKAQEVGVRLSLVVRPWAAPVGSKDLDVNLLGQPGKQITESLRNLGAPRSEDLLSGDFASAMYNTQAPSLINRFMPLAKTVGISRIVVLDPVLPGYGIESLGRSVQLARAVSEKVTFLGYSPTFREQFLVKFGSDPIDIPDERLRIPIDLRQPCFTDYRLSSSIGRFQRFELPSGVADLSFAWSEFRTKANATSLDSLIRTFTELRLPVLVQQGGTGSRSNFRNDIIASKWGAVANSESLNVLNLSGNVPPEMAEKSIALRLDSATRSQNPTAIDLTALPTSKWASFFARWFVRTAG